MSGFGDAAAVDPATNHVMMRSGDQGASLLDAAAGHESIGDMLLAEMAALGTPAPFSPDAANPAGPALGVAQAAATDGTQGALQASAKTMTEAGDATVQGGSAGPESMMSSMVGQLGGAFGQLGSSFGQISQVGGQLPQMLGQAP